jgi:hypothetical protein
MRRKTRLDPGYFYSANLRLTQTWFIWLSTIFTFVGLVFALVVRPITFLFGFEYNIAAAFVADVAISCGLPIGAMLFYYSYRKQKS